MDVPYIGAYTSFGIITTYYAGSMVPTLYKLPNYKYQGYRVYTNLPVAGKLFLSIRNMAWTPRPVKCVQGIAFGRQLETVQHR